MILSHLADELLAGCPLTKAGFLFWVFTPPGADTWVHGIHADPDPDVGYRTDLVRNAGAGWSADTGGWIGTPDIVSTPWISSNTNGWAAHSNSTDQTLEFWRRTGGGWSLIDSIDNSGTILHGGAVYTTAPDAAWAVYLTGTINHQVFLGTWNGSSLDWVDYTGGPDRRVDVAILRGAADNLWLVIQQNKGTGSDRENTWIRQLAGSTPNPDYTDATGDNVDSACNELYVCPDGSLWGAGWQWAIGTGTARHAALWRHDGSTGWTVSLPPLPATEATSRFYSVHGVSADDVWAVGYWVDTSNTTRVLIEHWDGAAWTIATPSPDYSSAAGLIDPYLVSVQMRATDDAWAVGAACSQWLSMHWDGSAWTEAPITGV